jgi:hypothetical protein
MIASITKSSRHLARSFAPAPHNTSGFRRVSGEQSKQEQKKSRKYSAFHVIFIPLIVFRHGVFLNFLSLRPLKKDHYKCVYAARTHPAAATRPCRFSRQTTRGTPASGRLHTRGWSSCRICRFVNCHAHARGHLCIQRSYGWTWCRSWCTPDIWSNRHKQESDRRQVQARTGIVIANNRG